MVGQHYGRIRALRDMARGKLTEATPAMPVEVAGLKGVPAAGDTMLLVASEDRARKVRGGVSVCVCM